MGIIGCPRGFPWVTEFPRESAGILAENGGLPWEFVNDCRGFLWVTAFTTGDGGDSREKPRYIVRIAGFPLEFVLVPAVPAG